VVAPYPSKNMKKSLFYTLAFFALLSVLASCKKGGGNTTVPPALVLKGTWKATNVQINGTGQNIAATGQPYANFQIVIDGTTDESGTYTVSGMPLPFPASFAGNWAKVGNTFTFSTGAPNGITSLTNFNVSGNTATFIMVQTHPKVSVTLHFTMTKQ